MAKSYLTFYNIDSQFFFFCYQFIIMRYYKLLITRRIIHARTSKTIFENYFLPPFSKNGFNIIVILKKSELFET